MKKIKIIALLLLLSTASFAQTNKLEEVKYEIMNVEIYYIAGLTGIYISHLDKEPEFIEMDRLLTKKIIKEQVMIVQRVFQDLYDKGWVIENSSGSPTLTRYILKRPKR